MYVLSRPLKVPLLDINIMWCRNNQKNEFLTGKILMNTLSSWDNKSEILVVGFEVI